MMIHPVQGGRAGGECLKFPLRPGVCQWRPTRLEGRDAPGETKALSKKSPACRLAIGERQNTGLQTAHDTKAAFSICLLHRASALMGNVPSVS